MSAEGLDALIGDLMVRGVQVTVPRFKIEAGFSLNQTLARLGMTDAFGAGADFSGMTGTGGLHISEAIHKAVIEVNEEGTEAAAATVSIIQTDMVIFLADRPFLFARATGRPGQSCSSEGSSIQAHESVCRPAHSPAGRGPCVAALAP